VTGVLPPQAIPPHGFGRLHKRGLELWPYTWIYPPEEAIRVFQDNSIVAPANGAQTQVLSYTVPNGFQFVMSHVLQVFSQSAPNFVPGSGQVTWVLDVNQPIGTTVVQGYSVNGYSSKVIPLGSLTSGSPWPLVRPEQFRPQDTIRSKVTTVSPIPVGGLNFFTSAFIGWLMPLSE
jgi:hypothetical protein